MKTVWCYVCTVGLISHGNNKCFYLVNHAINSLKVVEQNLTNSGINIIKNTKKYKAEQ